MANAVLGGDGDNFALGAEYDSYFDAVSVIESHRVSIAKLIANGRFDDLKSEASLVKKIAGDLCRLALKPDSGVPMSVTNEVVQNHG